jgi:transcriptional regulator with XRE-family HTH domain
VSGRQAPGAPPDRPGPATEPGLEADGSPLDDEAAGQAILATAIGARVRSERRRLGVTLEDAAEAARTSPAMLSRIENGKALPSLRTLTRLSRALTIPMGEFFGALEDDREATLVKAGQGIKVTDPARSHGHRYEILAPPSSRRAHVEPWLSVITDASEVFPLYQATGIGFIYMLEGRMRFRCGRQLLEVEPGDSILYDLSVPHRQEPVEAPIRFVHVSVASAAPSPRPDPSPGLFDGDPTRLGSDGNRASS